MRKASREINVFSLSAMDLFASAMGAFMLICLVALPYYLKGSEERQHIADLMEQNREARDGLDRIRAEIDGEERAASQAQTQARQQQAQVQQQQQQIQGMQRDLANAALVVMAKWETPADIDLFVITPGGNQYDAHKHNRPPAGRPGAPRPHYPAENAELSLDANGTNPAIPNARGKSGIEVWMAIGAGPGDYKVYLQRCSRHEDPHPTSTRVELIVIHQDVYLYKTVEEVVLSGNPNSRPANTSAVVSISNEGRATLH